MNKKIVAIIDRHPDIQTLLKHLIERDFEADCICCSSLDEFQILFQKNKFDLIISDDLGSIKNRKSFFNFIDQHGFCGPVIIYTSHSLGELWNLGGDGQLKVIYEKRHLELVKLLMGDKILPVKS